MMFFGVVADKNIARCHTAARFSLRVAAARQESRLLMLIDLIFRRRFQYTVMAQMSPCQPLPPPPSFSDAFNIFRQQATNTPRYAADSRFCRVIQRARVQR